MTAILYFGHIGKWKIKNCVIFDIVVLKNIHMATKMNLISTKRCDLCRFVIFRRKNGDHFDFRPYWIVTDIVFCYYWHSCTLKHTFSHKNELNILKIVHFMLISIGSFFHYFFLHFWIQHKIWHKTRGVPKGYGEKMVYVPTPTLRVEKLL